MIQRFQKLLEKILDLYIFVSVEYMKHNKVDFLNIIFETQYNHWSLYPVILCMILWNYSIQKIVPQPELLGWALCGIFPLCSKFLTLKISNKIIYIISHVIVAAGIVFSEVCLSENYPLYIMALVIYFAIAMFMRFVHNKFLTNGMYSLIIPLATSVISLLVLDSIDYAFFEDYYIMFIVILIIVYVLGYYFEHYLSSITKNEGSAGNMPSEAIFKSGFTMVLGLLLVILVGICIIINSDVIREFFDKIRDMILDGIAYVMGILGNSNTDDIGAITEQLEFKQEPETTDSDFLRVFNQIFWTCLYIFVTVVIGFGLYFIFNMIVNFFRDKMDNPPKVHIENAGKDVRESVWQKDGFKKKEKKGLFLNDTQKVRRMYQKKILSDKEFIKNEKSHNKKMQATTAREYSEYINNMTIADIYEKARYSGQPCDKEDVKRMKEACK